MNQTMKKRIIQIIKAYEHDAYFGADLCSLPDTEYESVAEEIEDLIRGSVTINGKLYFKNKIGEGYTDEDGFEVHFLNTKSI